VLRPDAGGQRVVDVEAGTVREALDTLVAQFPALKARVLEGDGVPSFLNVFVDGSDVRLLSGLDTSVSAGSKILLLPAVAGG
jgi:molybdopterin synthase sulfur carrier subunit